MNDEHIERAKLVYSLSMSKKAQDELFVRLIKKHEKTRTVCAKYVFEFWIRVQLHVIETKGEFSLVETYGKFLHIRHSSHHAIATIKKLIETYSDSAYRYLFVPTIMDYNDEYFVHQCALLYDFHNCQFVFYDPYGSYSRHGVSYINAVNDALKPLSKTLSVQTYHQLLGKKTGLQTLALEYNTRDKSAFEKDLSVLLSSIPANIRREADAQIRKNRMSESYKLDFTIDAISVLDLLYKEKQLEDKSLDKSEDKSLDKSLDKAYELYHKYSSKSCVSITIVELDRFFAGRPIENFPLENSPNDFIFAEIWKFAHGSKD